METIELFSQIKIPATVIHVIAVVVGMGGALLSDILFSFYAKDKTINKTERTTLEILSKIVWISLVVVILSGACIFLSDTAKYLTSDKFLAKMTILAVLLANGYILNSYAWKHLLRPGFFTKKRESTARKISFIGGAVSVISWLSVCLLGVLDSSPIGYSSILVTYGVLILIGIFTALFVEKKEFERGE